MSRDFDAEIANHDAELVRLRKEMKGATDAWLDAAAPYFEEYWKSFARETVVDQAEHSQAISASKVQDLRTNVEALAATSRMFIQRRIVDERPEGWPHLLPQTSAEDGRFAHYGQSDFQIVRNGVRLQTPTPLGHVVGQVLAEVYEIIKQYDYSVPNVSQFQDRRYSVVAYDHPTWTPQMVEALEKYVALHEKYIKVLAAQAEVEREKAQAAAADMWGE